MSKYDSIDDSPLEKGSRFCVVKDLDLACCLMTLGIRLRTNPPVSNIKLPDGNRSLTFYFCAESKDGAYRTEELIKGYYNDAKFIQENPEHPMSFLIALVKNKVSMRNAVDKSIPCLAFRKTVNSGAVIYVQEGSIKHRNCLSKGMVQVDPSVLVKETKAN